ncbi:biotin/lipoyl-binding protein [Herbiconiux sp. CPCC 205716]|uniref:Biotin/lipoyl-binding protein n=1 Tax=Herbiconiux gentiana TaxID=2970912 RepID=A0ABT2GDB8_9MICO|nr:biotin/lipoyl-binding protein [Herbiconiux gentiana]MCS5714111.1 biotin/lipoyl-binding protein [Herbiconiux gentiana]
MKSIRPLRRPSRLRRRTKIIIAAATVLVVAGCASAVVVQLTSGAASASASADGPVSRTVAASLETLDKTVAATGTLAPSVDEDVAFEVAGTVTAVNVVAGSTVTAGDVLATVDTLSVQADLLEAEANLASARAALASAESDDDGSDADTATIAAASAAVDVAAKSVDTASAAVGKTTLTAPVSGLVTAVGLAVGDVVGGQSSSTGSTPSTGTDSGTSAAQFTIVGTDSWEAALTVGERDVTNVAVGDQVEFSTDDGDSFFGTVSEVGLLPSTSSGAAAYPVTVAVTGSPDGLHDGIAVTASIVYERRTDVLTVPSGAVTTADDGTSTVTVVDADGGESTRTVTVGETAGDLTEIVEGLVEGETVQVTVFTPGSGSGSGTTQLPDGLDPSQFGGELPEGFDPGRFGGQAPGGAVNGG